VECCRGGVVVGVVRDGGGSSGNGIRIEGEEEGRLKGFRNGK